MAPICLRADIARATTPRALRAFSSRHPGAATNAALASWNPTGYFRWSTRAWVAAMVVAIMLGRPTFVNAQVCATPGQWLATAGAPAPVSQFTLLQQLEGNRVILLGEEHDDAQHHAWQLHMLAALHARQPDMVIGFEGFPRRVQPVLAQWVDGRLSETEFLRAVDWDQIWGLDAGLYMPIFQFARMHRISLVALNVDRALVRRVGRSGWSDIPALERQGVGDPEPASSDYLDKLYGAFRSHGPSVGASRDHDDPAFRNFVDSMLLWDRAMAEALAGAIAAGRPAAGPAPLAVGIVGRGHAEFFHGIPRQLAAMGIDDVAVLLPWNVHGACSAPPAGIANAVFGLQGQAMQGTGPRLGIELGSLENSAGARIHRIVEGSVAAASGLRDGDIIEKIAGVDVAGVETVIAAVRRQAPGSWLPLAIRRDGKALEIVAKFPPDVR